MIQIIPSISISHGKVVHMRQGDPSSLKPLDVNPFELAKQFADCGIEVIHLVDLDGAEKGTPKNFHVLETLAAYLDVKIDFTGGIHTDGDVTKALEFGADYITAASVAISNPELFASWIVSIGREIITLGIAISDVKTKKIAYRGWERFADISFFEHLQYFYDRGLKYAKITDISHDGAMNGPSFELYGEVMKKFPELKILSSGGVRHVDDIKKLNDMGVFAVIFKQAYYEGKIKLDELKPFIVKPAS